jgi:hypothetical protein
VAWREGELGGMSSFCASGWHATSEWERWGLQTRGQGGKRGGGQKKEA